LSLLRWSIPLPQPPGDPASTDKPDGTILAASSELFNKPAAKKPVRLNGVV
jgi:hypothetical protein